MSAAGALLGYVPFVHPLPVWDWWMLLLIPLTVGVSVAYKAIKCRHMSQVPREATQIAVLILLGMLAAAAVLWAIVRVREMMV
jgi:ABC-type multidrug transport system permease subunit